MRRWASTRKRARSHQKPTMFLPWPWTPSFQNCNVFTGREREEALWYNFCKALIPSDPGPTLMISSDPNYLPKDTFPDAITLGLGFNIWFGRIQSVYNTTEKRWIMMPYIPAISLSQLSWASDDFRRRLASTFVYIHSSILLSMAGGGGNETSVGKFGLSCELIVKSFWPKHGKLTSGGPNLCEALNWKQDVSWIWCTPVLKNLTL